MDRRGRGHRVAGRPAGWRYSLLLRSVYSPSCMKKTIDSSADIFPFTDGYIRPRPDHILTPRRHGMVLFEPPAATFAAALAAQPVPAATPLTSSDFRRQAREDLLSSIQEHALAIGIAGPTADILTRPWVITGHQVECYHAGVWAKVIAADHLAQRANAVAIDLLVDHDVLSHLGLEVPMMESGHLARQRITWDEHAPSVAAEFITAPPPLKRQRWIDAINSTSLLKSDAWKDFASRLYAGRVGDYVTWLSQARFGFEASLGLKVWHAPCSRLCQKPAWLGFVTAWISQAEAWTAQYNAALHRYRVAKHIRNTAQPMPDLVLSAQTLELPFWIYGPGQPRSRLIISRGPVPSLMTPAGPIAMPVMCDADCYQQGQALSQLLARHNLAIRPRALTLTMFARLALANVFIHGIGGAIYDQITDHLMESFFGIVSPYGCVSAGWLLDLPGRDESPVSIADLRWQHHHLRHNPQLALPREYEADPAVRGLLHARLENIRMIRDSLQADRRVARGCRDGSAARRNWFRQLHQINEQLLVRTQLVLNQIDQQLACLHLHAVEITAAKWREYFFALHTLDSLHALINAIRKNPTAP